MDRSLITVKSLLMKVELSRAFLEKQLAVLTRLQITGQRKQQRLVNIAVQNTILKTKTLAMD